MSEMAFKWIVVILFCISNIQTFLIFCALTTIHKNTEWGRFILPPQIKFLGGIDDEARRDNTETSENT